MKLAKQAVAYYTTVTGNKWSQFYDNLDEDLQMPIETQTGELWLIHALMDTVLKNGLTLDEFKQNKDAVKALFDEEGRKKAGEFFTPVVWAEELHRYMDKYIPNWRTDYNVWEGSCGSGNLIRTAKITPEHLFASTLQEDDVTLIRNTPELAGCTAFQCDFLQGIDHEENTEFLDNLPPRLKEIIQNDEPLVILMNPPYKSGSAKATDVGNYMINCSTPEVNLAMPAYDIFYQF